MQLLGQAVVRLAYFRGRSRLGDAENFVWVFHWPSAKTNIDWTTPKRRAKRNRFFAAAEERGDHADPFSTLTRFSLAPQRKRRVRGGGTVPRNFIQRHGMQLRFCLRVTVAALSALALGRLFGFPMVLWAVLSAVILTQMSIGKSVKATIDYSLGTLGGAIYAGLVAVSVPHSSDAAFAVVLAAAMAPLALLAAMSPRFAARSHHRRDRRSGPDPHAWHVSRLRRGSRPRSGAGRHGRPGGLPSGVSDARPQAGERRRRRHARSDRGHSSGSVLGLHAKIQRGRHQRPAARRRRRLLQIGFDSRRSQA